MKTVMTRRECLLTLGAGASLFGANAKKPNIIFFLVDDLGWSDFSCYGGKYYETPNIDRFAKQAMRFTSAYAACPVCSPTRASIMTGKYPQRTGITDWLPGGKPPANSILRTPGIPTEMKLEEVTIPEMLKPLGYRTASIGKWHLGGKGFLPQDQGFEVNIAGNDRGNPGNYFGPFNFPNLQGGTKDDFITEKLSDAADTFITECAGKTPFFLYFPEYAVHTPLQARRDAIDKYKTKFGDKPFPNPIYAAMVESIDQAFGRLYKTLDRLGITDNTIIMVTSDNGGLITEGRHQSAVTDNSPLRAGKGHLFEGGIREPLIVSWPGVTKPGSTCDVPVSSIDYLPTILEMAGGEPPKSGQIDGKSITGLLRGQNKPVHEAIFWHYPHYSPQGGTPACAVRKGDWKLIEFFEDGRLELFNLRQDIGERKNLVRKEPKIVAELHALLQNWRKDVGAVLPTKNPAFDPAIVGEPRGGYEPPTPIA